MAYEKQNFKAGQVLKAEHLNKMEEGIAAVEEGIAAVEEGVAGLTPIVSTADITAGSAAPDGRSYHVIE